MATRAPRLTCARALRGGLALLTAATAYGLATVAAAQNYPTRPITLVVPFPPGGSTTIVARIVTDRMADAIGQQFVVDNRGGAGGTLGTRQVAKSAPDGYTILLGYTGTLAIGPSLFPNVGYDVRADFAPIGRIAAAPSAVVVHPSFPAHSVAELIAYAKANPGKVNYGSAGIGTVGHVAGEYFAIATGIRLVHIPYKGTGPAITDLLGGHIPLSFSPIPAVHESAKSGLLRMLAVTSAKRSTLLPDTPTVAESGVPGFDAVLRYGLVAPAGTPRPIIERLNAALRAALDSAEVRNRLAIEGAEPLPSTPEEYAADIDHEETQWSKVIKASGAKAE
ncbi:MAG TPA: tripartite tricarboxylate transporter substrate binding protein [Xanthobacteraceae bacterium]|jgi:tripartite-type tricarboxylate transporter receptor subunit TctC|nr:tripartite tricarboxylate transporter substrate binding protein [Xanthobacteraceae bacterium]